jgi:prophage DNA circulation protein
MKKYLAAVVLMTVLMSSCSQPVSIEDYTDRTGTTTTAATTKATTTKPPVTTTVAETTVGLADIISKLTPTQTDILNDYNAYITQIATLLEEETDILNTFGAIRGNNKPDKETIKDTLKNSLIPKAEAFVESIKAIEINDAELQEINDLYAAGWGKQIECFKLLLEFTENNDTEIEQKAYVALDEGNKLIREFLNAVGDYVAENGIITEVTTA